MSPKPAIYSTVRFSSKSIQALAPGDSLIGKGLPNSKVILSISQKAGEANLKTNQNGDWSYKIPTNIKDGTYRLSILSLDANDQLAGIKSYQIKIISKSFLLDINFDFFKIKSAGAQGINQDLFSNPEFLKWRNYMRFCFHTIPDVQNGEIVLYDEQRWETEHPGAQLWAAPSAQESVSCNFKVSNVDFIQLLTEKLYYNKYYPIESLTPYFPEIEEFLQNNLQNQYNIWDSKLISGKAFYEGSSTDWKDTIDEATLTQYINEASSQIGDVRYRQQHPEAYTADLIEIGDSLVGIGNLIKVIVAMPQLAPSSPDSGNFIDAMFTATLLWGQALKAGKGTYLAISDVLDMAREGSVIRRSIQTGEFVALEPLLGRPKSWGYHPSLPGPKFPVGLNPIREGGFPRPLSASGIFNFNGDVLPAIQARQAWSFSRQDILRPAASNVQSVIAQVEARLGRKIPIDPDFRSFVENAMAFVIPRRFFRDPSAAYAAGDMVVISLESFQSPSGLFDLTHEIWHRIGNRKTILKDGTIVYMLPPGGGWFYKGPGEKNKVFTAIYELATDYGASLALKENPLSYGSSFLAGSYAYQNPRMVNVMQRMFERDPRLADSFLEFSLTGDSGALVRSTLNLTSSQNLLKKLFPSAVGQTDYEKFLALFRRGYGVNWSAITYLGVGGTILTEELRTVSDEEKAMIDPAFTVNDDFITDGYDESSDDYDKKITIDSVRGDIVPGGQLTVSALLSSGDGTSLMNEEFAETWALDQNPESTPQSTSEIQALEGGENVRGHAVLFYQTI